MEDLPQNVTEICFASCVTAEDTAYPRTNTLIIQSPHPVQGQSLDTGNVKFVESREEGTTTGNDQIGSRHGLWRRRQRLLEGSPLGSGLAEAVGWGSILSG